MGKKMKLPFLFKNTEPARTSWTWPSCTQPRTLSFRNGDNLNTSYFDASETPEVDSSGNSIETVIRGLRSAERLFFEPGETSSILEEAKAAAAAAAAAGGGGGYFPFKESTVVLSMESRDPCVDFRKSMEEMVEANGVKDWEGLEELLCWYLRVNAKDNHDYIVRAFVDLLVALAFASSSSCTTTHSPSPSSPLSFYTSSSSSSSSTPCVSSLKVEDNFDEKDDASSLDV